MLFGFFWKGCRRVGFKLVILIFLYILGGRGGGCFDVVWVLFGVFRDRCSFFRELGNNFGFGNREMGRVGRG